MQKILKWINKKGILNYQNLSGLTTIPELIEKIAGLSLFITNDSGPMHIAAAYKVKLYQFLDQQNLLRQINGETIKMVW